MTDRRARKKAATQGKLMQAARELFAERGVDATRINEITDRADVGFGSFYNYFADKDAIVEAVMRAMTEEHGATVERLTAGLDDPAEVMSVAHRHFMRLALAEPTWGRLVVRLEASHQVLATALAERALRDLQAGIDASRFDVPDVGLTLRAMGGTLIGSIQSVVDGHTIDDADVRHAELILRMLGLAQDDAAQVAARPLPQVDTA